VQTSDLLFGIGYPLSIGVIARLMPVVRERRWHWLAVHHLGVAAIITGWALRGEASAVAVNSSWLAASSAWYALGRQRASSRR
jgi:hypothetical protein